MGKHREREAYVNKLNTAARACGVALVQKQAKRSEVQRLAKAIQDSRGPKASKKIAADTLQLYEASFVKNETSEIVHVAADIAEVGGVEPAAEENTQFQQTYGARLFKQLVPKQIGFTCYIFTYRAQKSRQ